VAVILRSDGCRRLLERINTFNPDVILAHSLESIIGDTGGGMSAENLARPQRTLACDADKMR